MEREVIYGLSIRTSVKNFQYFLRSLNCISLVGLLILIFFMVRKRRHQSCPILSHCYGPLRAVDGSYAPKQTVSVANGPYSEHIRSVHLIMTSEHSVLWSVRIVTVRMLRAVDGSYAPYKPSALLTVRILSTYGACISL